MTPPNPSPNWHEPAWQNCPAGQFIFFRQLTHLSWYPQNGLIGWYAQCKSLVHSAHVLKRQFLFFSLLRYHMFGDVALSYFSSLNKLAKKSKMKRRIIRLNINNMINTYSRLVLYLICIYSYFWRHRKNLSCLYIC